jgi:ATP-dependent Clp protease ATP-binding subunit ClpA
VFDRYSDDSRRSMALARKEALRLGHDYIGTEHILLGILAQEASGAVQMLENLGADLAKLREELKRRVPPGLSWTTTGQIPFTSEGKDALVLSMKAADRFGHAWIGTEHLLLGLLEEPRGIAGQALKSLGVGLDAASVAVKKVFLEHSSEIKGAARVELVDEGGKVLVSMNLEPGLGVVIRRTGPTPDSKPIHCIFQEGRYLLTLHPAWRSRAMRFVYRDQNGEVLSQGAGPEAESD